MILFIYANVLHRVKVCFATKSFMHTPLISLLRVSKERCEEYTVGFQEKVGRLVLN
jgi:hypothetical protein